MMRKNRWLLFAFAILFVVTGLLIGRYLSSDKAKPDALGALLGKSLKEKLPSNGLIVVSPPSLMMSVAKAIPVSAEERSIIRPEGFFKDGHLSKKADWAGYRWILVGGEADAVDAENLLSILKGKGRFAYLSARSPSAVSNLLNAKFYRLDETADDGDEYLLAIYFRGDGALMAPAFRPEELKTMLESEPLPAAPEADSAESDPYLTRMKLSFHHLTTALDELKGFIPYFDIELNKPNPRIRHAAWDWCDISSRYALAILSVGDRVAPSSWTPEMRARFIALQTQVLSSIRADGLAYRHDDSFSDVEADIFDQGSVLLYLTEKLRRTKNEFYKTAIKNIISGLRRQAAASPNGIRFPYPTVLPDGTRGIGAGNWGVADPAHHGGRLLYPLALYLQLEPNDQTALGLFNDIRNYVIHDSKLFGEDGSFYGHSHARTNTLLGLLIRAQETHDEESLNYARRSVDWLIETTPRWGWIPEFIFRQGQTDERGERAETDSLADLIAILIRLADLYPKYWDVLERYAANGILSAQWTPEHSKAAGYPPSPMIDGVFCGFCKPNAFGDRTMNCCTPAGAIALHDIDRCAVEAEKETLRVNLLLSHDDQTVTVTRTMAQNEMVIEIKLKTSRRLLVRLPADGLLKLRQTESSVSESAGFLDFGQKEKGTTIKLIFTAEVAEETFILGKKKYRTKWAGHQLIDPFNAD